MRRRAAVHARRRRRHARDECARCRRKARPAADGPQPLGSLVRHGDLVEAHGRAHHRFEDDVSAGAGRRRARRALPRGEWREDDSAGRRRDDESGAMEPQRRSCGESGAAQPCRVESGAACPIRRPAALRAGVAEDFPNGGGNRAYLFTVDGPDGRFSWFFSNSASAVDLHVPIVVDGVDYGAPIENLKTAMQRRAAGRRSISGSARARCAVAKLVVPVLKPEGIHSGALGRFVGRVRSGRAEALRGCRRSRAFFSASGVTVVKPAQYMDKWRLDRNGVRPIANTRGEEGAWVQLDRVRALIFDFDGLIVDSESPGFQAWSELYASHGCSLPFDKYSACIGTIDGFDLHGYLEEQSGPIVRSRGAGSRLQRRAGSSSCRTQPLLPGIAVVRRIGEGAGLEAGRRVELDAEMGDATICRNSTCSTRSTRSARATMSRR